MLGRNTGKEGKEGKETKEEKKQAARRPSASSSGASAPSSARNRGPINPRYPFLLDEVDDTLSTGAHNLPPSVLVRLHEPHASRLEHNLLGLTNHRPWDVSARASLDNRRVTFLPDGLTADFDPDTLRTTYREHKPVEQPFMQGLGRVRLRYRHNQQTILATVSALLCSPSTPSSSLHLGVTGTPGLVSLSMPLRMTAGLVGLSSLNTVTEESDEWTAEEQLTPRDRAFSRGANITSSASSTATSNYVADSDFDETNYGVNFTVTLTEKQRRIIGHLNAMPQFTVHPLSPKELRFLKEHPSLKAQVEARYGNYTDPNCFISFELPKRPVLITSASVTTPTTKTKPSAFMQLTQLWQKSSPVLQHQSPPAKYTPSLIRDAETLTRVFSETKFALPKQTGSTIVEVTLTLPGQSPLTISNPHIDKKQETKKKEKKLQNPIKLHIKPGHVTNEARRMMTDAKLRDTLYQPLGINNRQLFERRIETLAAALLQQVRANSHKTEKKTGSNAHIATLKTNPQLQHDIQQLIQCVTAFRSHVKIAIAQAKKQAQVIQNQWPTKTLAAFNATSDDIGYSCDKELFYIQTATGSSKDITPIAIRFDKKNLLTLRAAHTALEDLLKRLSLKYQTRPARSAAAVTPQLAAQTAKAATPTSSAQKSDKNATPSARRLLPKKR